MKAKILIVISLLIMLTGGVTLRVFSEDAPKGAPTAEEIQEKDTTDITPSAEEVQEDVSSPKNVPVSATSMDINDFEKEMEVGSSQSVSVALYPSDATDEITYSSSDTAVASISPGGKIDAKTVGKTEITVSAGSLSKKLALSVIVKTRNITLNSDYITLKIGERYQVKATVSPREASQSLSYKSSDTSVVKVSDSGVIKAKGLGSASVIVGNGELSTSVNVIVNNDTYGSGIMSFDHHGAETSSDSAQYDSAVKSSTENDKRVTPERLQKLQKNGGTLSIDKEAYSIYLDGADIVNCDNPFDDTLYITKNDDGYTFTAGGSSEFLPGEVTINFKDEDMRKCKYVYLLDSGSNKYSLFSELEDGSYRTDIAGSYRITYEKIKPERPDSRIVILAASAIGAIALLYLILRRVF